MGTILVPLFTHYRPAAPLVQAAYAGGLPICRGVEIIKAARRLNRNVVFGELRPHGLDHEIYEGFRRVEEKFPIRIAADLGSHSVRLRPASQFLELSARRFAQEGDLRTELVLVAMG